MKAAFILVIAFLKLITDLQNIVFAISTIYTTFFQKPSYFLMRGNNWEVFSSMKQKPKCIKYHTASLISPNEVYEDEM